MIQVKEWRKRKGVGSIIGGAFILLTFTSIVTMLYMFMNVSYNMNDVYSRSSEMDALAQNENIEYVSILKTAGNKLNITVRNQGQITSHLTHIIAINKTAEPDTQESHQLNIFLSPGEVIKNITGDLINVTDGETKELRLLTALGNVYISEYPVADSGSSGSGGSSSQYYIDYSQADLHPNSTAGTHSFFDAMKGYPDSLLNVLSESAVISVPPQVDYVDNNSSDVDSSTDKGTHSYFNNQKARDGSMDTLTEKDTWSGAHNGTVLIQPTSFNDLNNRWSSESNAYDENNGTSSTETQGRVRNDIYWTTWNNTDKGTIVSVDLHIRLDITGLSNDFLTIQWWVGSTQGAGTHTINSGNQGTDLKFSFLNVTEPNDGIWSSTDIGNIEIRQVGTKVGPDDSVTYLTDEVWGAVTYIFNRYELDLEVQFTSVDTTTYNLTDICILTGTGDAEDLIVQLWNGTASEWNTIFSDLSASSWNNYTFKSGDIGFGSTTTIRFLGGTDTSDSTQSNWNIDVVLLNQYSSFNYEVDLEVQFSNLPQASNEYLSIFGGVQGAENLEVDIWNGVQYVNVIPDIQAGWNHVNVSSYHTGPTFNIRFKDTIRVSDFTQNQWEIDALYLNLWD
jgi:hypothetical protein